MSSRTVALVACGTGKHSAVASRVTDIAAGLDRRSWETDIRDVALPRMSLTQRLFDRTPAPIRGHLERVGIEGDILPVTGLHAGAHLRRLTADAVVVLVPPFSLLAAAALALPARIPRVIDYGDPWSARVSAPLLARLTRLAERRAAATVDAVSYAGGPYLGDLLATTLRIRPWRVIAVPNTHDPRDTADLLPHRPHTERNGTPLDVVFGGYWYGRNGPGIVIDALAEVGPEVAQLTVVGGVAPPVEVRLRRAIGDSYRLVPSMSRQRLYSRLARADVAVIPLDRSSAVESRIPAKVYDCLAVGIPVVAVCPADAALLTVRGGDRFHHIDHRDMPGLAGLLDRAAADRSVLRSGPLGNGADRDDGADALDRMLRAVS